MPEAKTNGAMPTYEKARLQTVVQKQIREAAATTLKEFKLNTTQWMILGMLKDAASERKISVIAAQLQVEVPLITTLVQPLMAIGYVEQHADQTDKRSKPVTITEAGVSIINQIEHQLAAKLQPLEAGISRSDLSHYYATLQALIANAEKAGV